MEAMGGRLIIEREGIAIDAGGGGLGDVQGGGGRHRGVGRVAAGGESLEAGRHRQGLAGGQHTAPRHDRRAPRLESKGIVHHVVGRPLDGPGFADEAWSIGVAGLSSRRRFYADRSLPPARRWERRRLGGSAGVGLRSTVRFEALEV